MARADLAEWVRQARRGDPGAVGAIYGLLRQRLLPRLCLLARPPLDPEDVMEDAFLIVWRNLNRLRDEEKLLEYAWAVIRRLLAARRKEQERWVPVFVVHEPGCPDVALRNLAAEEALGEVLRRLGPKDLRLFHLLYQKGMTNREVGDVLGIADHPLRLQKSRLLGKLRRILRRVGFPPSGPVIP